VLQEGQWETARIASLILIEWAAAFSALSRKKKKKTLSAHLFISLIAAFRSYARTQESGSWEDVGVGTQCLFLQGFWLDTGSKGFCFFIFGSMRSSQRVIQLFHKTARQLIETRILFYCEDSKYLMTTGGIYIYIKQTPRGCQSSVKYLPIFTCYISVDIISHQASF